MSISPKVSQLTTAQVAYALEVSEKHARRLIKTKGLPTVTKNGGRGGHRFDLRVFIDWVVAERAPDVESGTAIAEQTRVNKERADKLAIENELARGNLCYVDDCTAAGMQASAAMKAELQGLPGRIANELAAASGVDAAICKDIVRREIERIGQRFAAAMSKLGEQPETVS